MVFKMSCWQILKSPNFQRNRTRKTPVLKCFLLLFFFIWTGNLLIILHQLIKFQAPSSNTFRDIAERFHSDFFNMQKFSNGHNSRTIRWFFFFFFFKPISWPSLKPSPVYFSRYHADKISFWFFPKGHNSKKGGNSDKKKNMSQLLFHEEPHMKFQNPSKHGSWRMDRCTDRQTTRNQYAPSISSKLGASPGNFSPKLTHTFR